MITVCAVTLTFLKKDEILGNIKLSENLEVEDIIMELRKEAKDLLFCMLRKGDWITGEEISRMLEWNKKKVQQNMKWLIEDVGKEGCIEIQKNKGYRVCRISERFRNEILKDTFYNEVYFNLDERRIILSMDLLFRRQYISMDQLAEDYYLSKSVVFEEIRQMRRWFSRNNDIQLEVSKQRGIYIHGEEKDKRYACTAWGPLHVLQMTKIDPDAVQCYQKSMEQAAEPLQQLLIDTGRLISGEEYSFILRYIAMSRLRSRLGYDLPEMSGKPTAYPSFYETLSRKLGYSFSASEQIEINKIIQEATILATKSHPDAKLENLHMLESYFNQKLKLSQHFHFENSELIAENLNALLERHYHRVNYYDKSILIKYPLEIHLVKQAFQDVFAKKLPRTEILNMAAFLGSYLDTIHCPSTVHILLVGNQSFYLMENLRKYICQMLSLTPERVDYLPGYAWNSSLPRDIDYYTIFLTTEPEIALKNNQFRLIPIIMTNENCETLKSILNDCCKTNHIQRMAQMERNIQYKTLSHLEKIELLLPKENPAAITTYALNRNTLCVICTTPTVQTGVEFITLEKPFSYDFIEISTIKILKFKDDEQGIIDFFHEASDILQK